MSRILLLCGLTHAVAQVPLAMEGTWVGNVTASPSGPSHYPGAGMPDFLVVSSKDPDGNYFLKHKYEAQLMRVQGTMMQYCFAYDQPEAHVTGADEAPFQLEPSDDSQVLRFCWRGRRLPSHKANCSGCDCAQWTLRVHGDRIQSEFMMSPPAIHLSINLTRSGPAPKPESVRDGWNCTFDNYTGFPNRTKQSDLKELDLVAKPRCPFAVGAAKPASSSSLAARADAGGQVRNCVMLGNAWMQYFYKVKLEYVASKVPCMPCDVSFTISMIDRVVGDAPHYIAIGFKERYGAYKDWDTRTDMPEYWGMSTSMTNATELGGRIMVGYVGKNGVDCVRHMRADAFVGSVIDVENDGAIRNTSVSMVNGRISLKFTMSFHLGESEYAMSPFSTHFSDFGSQRVMWAAGNVGDDGECSATLGYHGGDRMVASLSFPSYSTPCSNEAPASDSFVLL